MKFLTVIDLDILNLKIYVKNMSGHQFCYHVLLYVWRTTTHAPPLPPCSHRLTKPKHLVGDI